MWAWKLDGPSPLLVPSSEADWTILSPAESARASRFVSPQHQIRFVAAHAGLRRILSGYLQVAPADLSFEQDRHGKPRLAGVDSTLRFNLSHSHDLALLAVGHGIEVGVDVEFVRPISEGIAERFFAPSEIGALAALPGAERLTAFYACWTRKEAFLKGLGTGIAEGGLDTFAVSIAGQGPPTLSDHGSGITAGWSLRHLDPAPGYVGALAARSGDPALQSFSAAFAP